MSASQMPEVPACLEARCDHATSQLSSKDYIDTGAKEFQLTSRKPAHSLRQKIPIQRYNLRDVGHGVLREPGKTGRQGNIPRRIRPSEVAGERHAHYSCNSALV